MRPSNRAPLPAKLEFCAIRRRAAGGSPGPGCGDRHGFLHRRRDHRRSRWRACGARRWPASPSPLMPQVPFVSPARSPACKPPRGVARWLALPGLQRADHPRRSAAARLVGTRGTQFGGAALVHDAPDERRASTRSALERENGDRHDPANWESCRLGRSRLCVPGVLLVTGVPGPAGMAWGHWLGCRCRAGLSAPVPAGASRQGA